MYKYYEEDKAMSKQMKEEYGEDVFDLPPRPKIEIEEPLALPGHEVVVDNYRLKYDSREVGAVTKVLARFDEYGNVAYQYYVSINWKSYTIVVGDRSILQNLTSGARF